MNILVTGHNGFIGRNLTAWLSAEGWNVEGWEWNPNNLPDIKVYDWVIHLGAITDQTETDVDKILEQNLEFSQWIFNECQANSVHLQYASTEAVYGNTKNFNELAPCSPQSPYAWSKYLFDRWAFQQPHSTYVQGFRYFNVYGKWMHIKKRNTNLIHIWREQAKTQKQLTVWDNADHIKWDWTWVGDICKLHVDFIKEVKGSGIWNAGSGLSHTLLDIANEIAEQAEVPIILVPMTVEEKTTVQVKTCADLTHLKHTVGKRKWLNVFEYLNQ